MKLCEVCGGPEHPEWRAHVFASNLASNGASNRKVIHGLVDKVVGKVGDVVSSEVGTVRSATGQGLVGEGKMVKQRWSREAYNAYQREYMRRRRGR